MASSLSTPMLIQTLSSHAPLPIPPSTSCRGRFPALTISASSDTAPGSSHQSTKLVIFLGKGGSGKTTAAVFAAQHYAMTGLNTCLVVHGQDPTADHLLNCKIGNAPVTCTSNLSAVRLETTQMLLEPLDHLKRADAHLNMTQGVLGGIIGEELGVLPGMDSIFLAIKLEKLVGFLRSEAQSKQKKEPYDMVIYDGISTEETLRMIGVTNKARLYLKYLRTLAEKTDIGRLAGPSLLQLVDEAMTISSSRSYFNGRMSAEIWDTLEEMLETGSSAFSDPRKFACFLVTDPDCPTSISAALRYWGCTIQAGAYVSGAFGISSLHMKGETSKRLKETFSPLCTAFIPHVSTNIPIDWNMILQNSAGEDARHLLCLPATQQNDMMPSVKFDSEKKLLTLFMPGFDKSEIKLYQYRGGSEFLVEAGDQRRVILLPPEIQGKIRGAKFLDKNLVITML